MLSLARRAAVSLAIALLATGAGAATTTNASAASPSCGPGMRQLSSGDFCVSRSDRRGKQLVAAAKSVKALRQNRATLFAVSSHGRLLAQGAMGDSLTGVPARRDMHFRIGNTTETMTTTLLLRQVDRGRLKLSDKVSRWFPSFPHAKQITLDMLARSTSGIPDYVRDQSFADAQNADPWRHWSPAQLLAYVKDKPLLFKPGTSWAFSDSNFVLLGRILARVAHTSVARQLTSQILKPLRLSDTRMMMNGNVQDPPLHAFTHERGPYEEATFWDPTWASYTANMTSSLADMTRWARVLGRGELLSRKSHKLQTGKENIGLGPLVKSRYYAMGVGVTSGWIVANPQLQGFNGIVAYNPKKDLTIVVSSTQTPTNSITVQYSTYYFIRFAKLLTGVAPNISADPRPNG